MGLNRQTILGNLAKDPEIRHTNNGVPVCTLRVGASMREKVSGEWTNVTEWFDCVLWNRQAELASTHLSKGDQVYLEGRTKTRQYTDREGQERRKTEVVVDRMEFTGGPRKKSSNTQTSDSGYSDRSYDRGSGNEEIPF